MNKTIAIIGGGAAGFFCAVNAAQKNPDYSIVLFEKSTKLLAKVLVSGGGRCNVTHACFDNQVLVKNYPRGEKQLKSVFSRFAVNDTIQWFGSRGVELSEEADGRMFPESNTSETIVNCLLSEAKKAKVDIRLQTELVQIGKEGNGFILHFREGSNFHCDKVVITSGGHPKEDNYSFLKQSGHSVKKPIPSLFTINLPGNAITQLMGLAANPATVKIAGTNYLYTGPVLITHWGLSGPAVLKLSAFAAEYFNEKKYNAGIIVNWVNQKEEEVRQYMTNYIQQKGNAQPHTQALFGLPRRLWEHLLHKAEFTSAKPWAETGKKQINKLVTLLTADEYLMEGKTTFKEEFVTCGGIPLNEVDLRTMQSKCCPGLYFAGEVLDIDGITGGFNFQAAWSTAWVAADNLSERVRE